jgi:hypothetical protein
MNKRWIVAIVVAGVIGGTALLSLTRLHAPAPPRAQSVAAPESVSPGSEPMLPDPSAVRTVSTVEPRAQDRVAALSSAIWQELNSPGEDGYDIVFTNLFPELIALDHLAAARLIENTALSREELMRHLVQTWVTNDAAAALEWAEQLADTDEQRRVLLYATIQIAEMDPSAAAATAARYHLEDGDGAILVSIALSWAGKNLPEALTWAASRAAGPQRDEIMARIAFVESRTAPEAAARRVIQEIPPGSVQVEAAISVLHQWALRDFDSANEWAGSFPPGPLRERALSELSAIADDRARISGRL